MKLVVTLRLNAKDLDAVAAALCLKVPEGTPHQRLRQRAAAVRVLRRRITDHANSMVAQSHMFYDALRKADSNGA